MLREGGLQIRQPLQRIALVVESGRVIRSSSQITAVGLDRLLIFSLGGRVLCQHLVILALGVRDQT